MFVPIAISTNTWTAIGSVGTAAAVVVAGVSLWFERRSRKRTEAAEARERVEDEAAQIREKVKAAASRTREVASQLEKGYALIDASWRCAQSIRAQAGDPPSVGAMRALVGDSGVALTAAVEGWVGSSAAAELRQAISSLAAAEDVAGDLNLFSPIAEILRRIVTDGYPPLIFMRLLTEMPAEAFLEENKDEDVDALTRAVAVHLHGNASLYFITRYESALKAIVAFVGSAGGAMLALDPFQLVGANRAKSAESPELSFTDQLREKLDGLERVLPASVITNLREELERIQVAIGRASAEARLAEMQLEKEAQGVAGA